MRASQLFGHTLREAPADAEIPSHRLLMRGAFIRRVAAGVYAWLPLGVRVLRRLEAIVREEMDAHGATELLMPALHPAELWERSGRWQDALGGELYKLTDPGDREWCLGPTHEEVATFLASTELPSYRDLPAIPYQIQWKFRYAPRPRGGLLRSREFLMKDAYSFDATPESMQASYDRMAGAYRRVFERCGLQAVRIEAEAGAIGGSVNHEFTQPCDAGEDTFVQCPSCGYAANTEAATSRVTASYRFGEPPDAPWKVHTPGMVTVEEVAGFLTITPAQLVKALVYRAGGDLVCALVPGDRELSEAKLARALDGAEVRMLTDTEFAETGIVKGFTGPVGLDGVKLIADRSLREAANVVTGANAPDHHLCGVVAGRDFQPEVWADLVVAVGGDGCPACEATLQARRGIEVGHVFQLGTKYSAAMDATFSDPSGIRKPFLMGCYGLGVSRTVAAIVEAHHDERGIVWPRAVAPFDVAVLAVAKGPDAAHEAERLYEELVSGGLQVLLDDREGVSAGVKFADADLIGHPLQVVVGRGFTESGRVETKVRATGTRGDVEPTREAVLQALDACP